MLTAAESLLGRQVGSYRIVSPLGAGGMGEVYRAHDGKLGRDVAVKTLPHEFARDPERLSRLRREARTLASLNHPNIAAIYGLVESEEVDCLVWNWSRGKRYVVHYRFKPRSTAPAKWRRTGSRA